MATSRKPSVSAARSPTLSTPEKSGAHGGGPATDGSALPGVADVAVTNKSIGAAKLGTDGLSRLSKVIADFWQLISSIVAIVAAIVGALTFFATRDQLIRLECLTNQTLLRQTLPGQISQLSMSIKLAQTELKDIQPGSMAAHAKSIEIDKYREDMKASQKQYNELPVVGTSYCDAQPEKKK
ncbi:hypothetical protein GCM10007320_65340 [Pseudorhodoferax aquiterrae]|uniref:Uncharacterized protein n=1 Tax=Pseudorhodoferax aquiterrae TaxID=747304 RepID=A0ABQ3GGY6_9BURK|nr:hypothetical protein [Pseudorhodoferax aquiterrae]GHD04442.1 hypothetical protein GCM10007320_65340 [Pseudorhodoferax aquiterrae]